MFHNKWDKVSEKMLLKLKLWYFISNYAFHHRF